jgi:hypothetical protein
MKRRDAIVMLAASIGGILPSELKACIFGRRRRTVAACPASIARPSPLALRDGPCLFRWFDQGNPRYLGVDSVGARVCVANDTAGGTIIPGSNLWILETVDLYNKVRLLNRATGKYLVQRSLGGVCTADGVGSYTIIQYTRTEHPEDSRMRIYQDIDFTRSNWLHVLPGSNLLTSGLDWPNMQNFGFVF